MLRAQVTTIRMRTGRTRGTKSKDSSWRGQAWLLGRSERLYQEGLGHAPGGMVRAQVGRGGEQGLLDAGRGVPAGYPSTAARGLSGWSGNASA